MRLLLAIAKWKMDYSSEGKTSVQKQNNNINFRTMKANFILIATAIALLGLIAIITNGQPHYLMILPLAYIGYAFIIGFISWCRNRFY
jgi:hypothetical protein